MSQWLLNCWLHFLQSALSRQSQVQNMMNYILGKLKLNFICNSSKCFSCTKLYFASLTECHLTKHTVIITTNTSWNYPCFSFYLSVSKVHCMKYVCFWDMNPHAVLNISKYFPRQHFIFLYSTIFFHLLLEKLYSTCHKLQIKDINLFCNMWS